MKHPNVSIGTRQLGAVFDEFLASKPAQITIGQAGGLEAMDFYGEIPRGPLQCAGILVGFEQDRERRTKLGDDSKHAGLRHFG
jgi:hypothetical protein